MGSQIIKNSGHTAYGLKEYVVDTLQELNELSVDDPQGSLATVINGGNLKYYMMNGNHEWKEIHLNNGSGGGSDAAGVNTLIIDVTYDETAPENSRFTYSLDSSLTYEQAKQILLDSYNGAPTIIEFIRTDTTISDDDTYEDNFWCINSTTGIKYLCGKFLVNLVWGEPNNEYVPHIDYLINLDQFSCASIRFVLNDDSQTILGEYSLVTPYEHFGARNIQIPLFRERVETEGALFAFSYIGFWNPSNATFEITSSSLLDAMKQTLNYYDQDPTHYYINSIVAYTGFNPEDDSTTLVPVPIEVGYLGSMLPSGNITDIANSNKKKISISSTDTTHMKAVILNGAFDFNPKNTIYYDI